MDYDKRIIDLTVADLIEVIDSRIKQLITENRPKRLVYGIAGIAEIFNCSTATAQRIKSSGRIDEAITQVGRIIQIDADKAIELFKNS